MRYYQGPRPARDRRERPLTPTELREQLRGVIAFAPTPFTEDDRVDLDGLARTVDDLVACGGPVAVCGAVGEYPALDLDEYRAVMRTAMATRRSRTRRPPPPAWSAGTAATTG